MKEMYMPKRHINMFRLTCNEENANIFKKGKLNENMKKWIFSLVLPLLMDNLTEYFKM